MQANNLILSRPQMALTCHKTLSFGVFNEFLPSFTYPVTFNCCDLWRLSIQDPALQKRVKTLKAKHPMYISWSVGFQVVRCMVQHMCDKCLKEGWATVTQSE